MLEGLGDRQVGLMSLAKQPGPFLTAHVRFLLLGCFAVRSMSRHVSVFKDLAIAAAQRDSRCLFKHQTNLGTFRPVVTIL